MQIIIQEHLKSEVQKMQHQCENDWQCGYQNALNDVLHIIDSLTPIELPNDDEIENKGKWVFNNDGHTISTHYNTVPSWVNGAKWIKEQILNQNK